MVSLAPATVATRARDEYDNLVASLPSHAGPGNACDMEVDDGGELMWAYSDGSGNDEAGLVCSGAATQVGDPYGPHVYASCLMS